MPSPTPAYTLPKTGPEMPERHHPAPSLAPGSSTTSHASWAMSLCTARTALQQRSCSHHHPTPLQQPVFLCPTCLYSPEFFSQWLIWISYAATEVTFIPADRGPGDQGNSGSLLSYTSTLLLFCPLASLSFNLSKTRSFNLPSYIMLPRHPTTLPALLQTFCIAVEALCSRWTPRSSPRPFAASCTQNPHRHISAWHLLFSNSKTAQALQPIVACIWLVNLNIPILLWRTHLWLHILCVELAPPAEMPCLLKPFLFIQMAEIVLSFHGVPCSFPVQDVGARRGQPVSEGPESEASTPGAAVAQHSFR